MNTPDDGGPAYPEPYVDSYGRLAGDGGMSLRARLAMEFAAAWLPIVETTSVGSGATDKELGSRSNELGLAMADDLIRRLRESK